MSRLFKKFDQWGIMISNGVPFISVLKWDESKAHKDQICDKIYLFDSYEATRRLNEMVKELSIPLDKNKYYPLVTKRALLMLLNILDIAHRDISGMDDYIDSVLQEALVIEERWEYLGIDRSNNDITTIIRQLTPK